MSQAGFNTLKNFELINKKHRKMSSSGNTFLGILAGTAVGAVLGVLFAPDKGSITRRRIADEATIAKHQLNESANELKHRLADTLTEGKQTLESRVESLVSDVSYKTEDVITTLEHKLRELKEKNKKLQKTS